MLIELGDDANIITLSAGQTLCEKGDELDAVFQLRSGTLAALDGDIELATLTAPALIGDITAVAGGSTTATVTAVDECTVSVIPLTRFARWLETNPDEAAAITATARGRADRTRATSIVADLVGRESPGAIKGLVDQLTWRTLQAGDLLFSQGDESDAAYVVITGRVRVTRVDGHGEVEFETDLGRGALVGELGIIEQHARSASVRATRATTLARLSSEDFEDTTAANPALTLRVVRSIFDRMQLSNRNLTRNRAVTIVVTDPAATDDVVDVFVDEVRNFGAAEFLSTESVDSVLGRAGLSSSEVGTIGHQRLTDLLHESEAESDYMVLHARVDQPGWIDRAIEQSDRVLIFTSPRPQLAERERIEAALSRSVTTSGRSSWIVKRYPPGHTPAGADEWLADHRVDDVHHVRADSPDDLRRVARLATGNGVGVVFGGGGARGFAHLGACRALTELGVPIDAVAGASIGAVIAALVAIDVPEGEREQMTADAFHKLLDYTVPIVALLRSQRITANIEEHLGSWQIENTWVPYLCVTTNLTTAGLRVHRSGSLSAAVRASVAIPGVLPPVTIDGDLLVDGGLLDNLPVDHLADDDRISTVIALDLEPPDAPETRSDFHPDVSGLRALRTRFDPREQNYPTLGSTIIRSLLVAAARRRAEVIDSGNIDLYLLLEVEGVGLLDFEKVPEVARLGHAAALPQIRAWLSRPSAER